MSVYSLDELNNWWHESNNVRKYQYLIVSQETFFLEYESNKYEFYQSNFEDNINTLIFKDLNSNNFFKIISQNCANGFLLINDLQKQSVNFSKNDKVVVYSGQYNFAHYIWNELSAMFLLFHKKKFFFTNTKNHDSFLNFENFLDSKFKKYKLDVKSVENFNHNSLKVGGIYICKKISYSLNRLFKSNIKPKNFFYFYIGIKGYNKHRCIVNEFEFYKELISHLSNSIPNVFFIIDGFSFVNNIQKNTRYFSNHCAQSQKVINKLLNFLTHNKINFEVINGYSLYESLEIIKLTDFYITHEGTMHHKINWFFHSKVGFILTGSSFSKSSALWHSSQCYGAQTPYVFDENNFIRVSGILYSKYYYYFFKFCLILLSYFFDKSKLKNIIESLYLRRHDRDGIFLITNIKKMIMDVNIKLKDY